MGHWINAVDENFGGIESFILGAYDPNAGYGLGTYGFDPASNTFWAVLNHASEFAVAITIVSVASLWAIRSRS